MNRKQLFIGLTVIMAGLLAITLYFVVARQKKGTLVSKASDSAQAEPQQTDSALSPGLDGGPTAAPDIPGVNLTQEDKAKLGKILTVFNAPISFYGKVIDQHGKRLAG